jgi:adenylate kinase family enzyme
MRIAIIGNAGSGKSTLASQLAIVHSLEALDLDTLAWEPGKIAVPRTPGVAAAEVRTFCGTHPRWVVEGCYSDLMGDVLDSSPTLLFMDPGVDACLANCRSRPWEPHKYASKEDQDSKLEFLLSWVKDYYTRQGALSLAAHRTLFDGYRGNKLRLTALVDRAFVEVQPLRWFSHDVDALAARFTACQIPEKEWTHAGHLVVGLWHVHRYGADEALTRLRAGIRQLNESQGGVNSATNGYHETITAAYVHLLSQFLASGAAETPLPDRVSMLLDSPVAGKRALSAFYSTERLMSTEARAGWMDPDLAPLDLATLVTDTLAQRP